MKRRFFALKAISQAYLVKGCPTDWNGDGHNNDDYNHDGETDQDDHDYYETHGCGNYYEDDDDDEENDDNDDDDDNDDPKTPSEDTGPEIDFNYSGSYY